MPETKITVLTKEDVLAVIKLMAFILMATIAPMLRFQSITGPLVNALLFLSVIFIGFPNAIFVAVIPSAISLATGHLPLILAPMIPFIMLGNLILMAVFAKLRKDYWLAVLMASSLKFLFLFFTSQALFSIIDKNLLLTVSGTMGWIQFFTAIIGGFIAYLILKFIRKTA